jgi:hypothetical protein
MDAVRPHHRRSKSSTSVLKSIVSPRTTKEKENTTPPSSSSSNVAPTYTPIWAEFATARTENISPTRHTTTKVALNDRSVTQEMNVHGPRDYSPSKQRHQQETPPMVAKKPKTKSGFMTKSKSSLSVFESVRKNISIQPAMAARKSTDTPPSFMNSKTTKVPLKSETPVDKMAKATKVASRDLFTMARKGSKVMGLVAAFNSKADQPAAAEAEPELDPKEIDAAFEAVLVRKSVLHNHC